MRVLPIFLLVVLSAGVANAQSGGGGGASRTTAIRAEIGPVIEPNSKVFVFNETGERIQGRLVEITDQTIILAASAGLAEVPLASILRIERPDGAGDGARAGLTLGITLGLLNGALARTNDRGAFMAGSAVGNGIVFAGIGALIDLAFDNSKTLYERGRGTRVTVAPLAGPDRAGVSVAARW
jgi:hypothetical protein